LSAVVQDANGHTRRFDNVAALHGEIEACQDVEIRVASPTTGIPKGRIMSRESRLLTGILLVVLPTVVLRGASLLSFLVADPAYMASPLQQELWRAGHVHAGIMLILSLVIVRYVDEARLPYVWKWVAQLATPTAAILLPLALFLSVLTPDVVRPNGFIFLRCSARCFGWGSSCAIGGFGS
jgi:hypothetical protein